MTSSPSGWRLLQKLHSRKTAGSAGAGGCTGTGSAGSWRERRLGKISAMKATIDRLDDLRAFERPGLYKDLSAMPIGRLALAGLADGGIPAGRAQAVPRRF